MPGVYTFDACASFSRPLLAAMQSSVGPLADTPAAAFAVDHDSVAGAFSPEKIQGCVRVSGDLALGPWLQTSQLQQDTLLSLHGLDWYDAHTALRHASTLSLGPHTCFVAMPPELRRHRAFTPWLAAGTTVSRSTVVDHPSPRGSGLPDPSYVMAFVANATHVHSELTDGGHAASFNIRIGGRTVRALFDTGATCSCLSKSAVQALGQQVTPSTDPPIMGVGGDSRVLGRLTTPVKIGKMQKEQSFVVLDSPIAGYEALIGQDFMLATNCTIAMTDSTCALTFQSDGARTQLSRPLRCSRAVSRAPSQGSAFPVLTPVSVDEHSPSDFVSSKRQFKHLMRDIRNEKQLAYSVKLHDPAEKEQETNLLTPEIQEVIDKHSAAGGTLCGDVPHGQTARGQEMHISVDSNARVVHCKQYRLTPAEEQALLDKTQEFIERGWIEPSSSAWNSSVLFVPKPNGGLRFCVDYRYLNQSTVKDSHPIPDMRALTDSMRGANVYSALDLCSGFYQIPLSKESRPVTAFSTPLGLYQWCVMPMGLCNSPAVFQRAMNEVLREHIKAGYCLVYLDDVLIMSPSVEEHAKHLDAVLCALAASNLYCQLPKCHFALGELRYLGHLVNGQGVRPDPKKVATLDAWNPPLDLVSELNAVDTSRQHAVVLRKRIVAAVRSFVGFMQYFSRFIPRFSHLAALLHDQTKDNAPDWTDDCTHAWNQLRVCLSRSTLMFHPDFDLPFHVFFDASIRGIGGLVAQEHDSVMQPVAFCARRMKPAEVNYTTTEQEFLAMIFCFQTWRCYLDGPKVFVHTDHEPLTWLKSQKNISRRQARWLEFLSRFSFELLYIKGDRNVCADALSRMLTFPEETSRPLPGDLWPHSATVAVLTPPIICRPPGELARQEHAGPLCVFAVAPLIAAASERVFMGGHTRRRAEQVDSRAAGEPSGTKQSDTGSGAPCVSESPAPADPNSGRQVHSSTVDLTSGASAGSSPVGLPPSQVSGPSDGPEVHPPGDSVHSDREDGASFAEQADRLSAHERLFDTLFTRIRSALLSDPEVKSDEQRRRLSLTENHGLLWRDNRLYIPDSDGLRQDVLFWHHDVPWMAHLGIKRTLDMVESQFYWPRLRCDVETYVKTCTDCQSNKTDRRRRTPALSPLIPPTSCWRTIGVDLIVDLPPTQEGHDSICVFVCHLSKMARLIPTHKNLTAKGFARLFMTHVFPHYGFPLDIISDRGVQWNNEFFRALCQRAGVKLNLSSSHHPQTNGLVERTNEVVEAALRHYVSAEMDDWDEMLPLIEFALNSSYHDSIQSTPFRMNRLTLPANPFDVLLAKSQEQSTELSGWMGLTPATQGERTFLQCHAEFERARRCVHASKERMKARHDGKGINTHLYSIGDHIWFNVRHVALRHTSRRGKLLPKYWGPFKVIELIGRNAVRLDMPQQLKHVHPVVSVSLLKPYRARVGVPIPDAPEADWQVHEVESVTDHNLVVSRRRNVSSVVEFRVKWKGSLEDTWHEPSDFGSAQHVLQMYLQSLTKKARVRVLRAFDPASLALLPEALRALVIPTDAPADAGLPPAP